MAVKAGQQNDALNLFKCVSIYAVVLAHIPLPGQFGQAVCALAKFSVVVFFLSSGYFSWERDSRTVGRRAWRTGLLLLEVSLFLLAMGCVLALRRGETVAAYLASRMNPFFLKEILLYQVMPLPYSWPLWFLASLFIVYLIWWAMTLAAQTLGKRLPYDLLALAALALLAIHLSLVEVRALRGQEPLASMYVRNAWLDAFPFFALGAWMGEHREKLTGRGGTAGLWAGVGLCVLLALGEFFLVGQVIDVFVGTTLLAVLLMVISLRSPGIDSPLLKRIACFCGKNLTFYIFALHVPLFGVMQEWKDQVAVFEWITARRWVTAAVVAALSTAMAWGLHQLFTGRKRKEQRT